MRNEPGITWPAADLSRVPFAAYHDPAIYDEEQTRIFRGPTWNYLALGAELPKPGDFVTTSMGDTPALVGRDEGGRLHGFVNRCMHRGMLLKRERCGNARNHTCIYHQWAYDLQGRLVGVPFPLGQGGHGGLPACSRRRTARRSNWCAARCRASAPVRRGVMRTDRARSWTSNFSELDTFPSRSRVRRPKLLN
jgi:phenylpropionate dioxygenase-like ring-hydroxylating dioxygenase large terminal subunit